MTHVQPSDDELRVLLKSIDPVPNLAPLPDVSHRLTTTAQRARRARFGRTRWLPVAIAVALAVVALAGILVRSNAPSQVTIAEQPVEQCPYRPIPTVLEGVDLAASGTVESVSAATVVLDVDHWYRGGRSAQQVAIRRVNGAFVSPRLGMNWQQGHRYLVSATDGILEECSGASGPWSSALAAEYGNAFH